MVAYSFKASFLGPITAREKQQTIRLPRKRHARPGEALQFFYGPRMKPVRHGAATCLATRDVRLDFAGSGVVTLDDAVEIFDPDELDAFAVRDGFNPDRIPEAQGLRPWTYLSRWWRFVHPAQPVFRGVLIDWGETFVPAPVAVDEHSEAA